MASSTLEHAHARGFAYGSPQGSLSTNAGKADGGQVPVIQWTGTPFQAAGRSKERRSQKASDQFNECLYKGLLAYITMGRNNCLAVICPARSNGGAWMDCFTALKPGQNATATLHNLLKSAPHTSTVCRSCPTF